MISGTLHDQICLKFSSIDNDGAILTKGVDGSILKDYLILKLKQCIWRFSAGVNVKRSLAGKQIEEMSNLPLYPLWSEEIEPKVTAFAAKYINHRLAVVRK